MSNQLAQYSFPDAYSTLVSGYTGTVKYVSSSGSDSNNGNTVSTPYLTIDNAITANSATTRLMIVVLQGTYTMTAVSGTSATASVAIRDGGNERVFVCCPGKTIIQWTANTADRDCVMVDFGNTASAIYGAILKRNNNARTTNYTVAFFRMTTKGSLFNCVFQETNANNAWSFQYDNYGYNNLAIKNSTFYNGAAPLGNYSNAGTVTINDTVFNTTCTTAGTETNVLKSQTVNSSTYVTTGVTTAGVYSGTYSWSGTLTLPNGLYTTSSNIKFGSSVVFTLYSANTGNIPYTITGVTSNLISNASLTGNFVISGGTANVTITTTNIVTSNTYTMSMTADTYTANVTLSPNVTITTESIGVGYTANTSYLANPISGQMNILKTVSTVAQYDVGGSSASLFAVAGQMNIYDSAVTVTDMTKGTPIGTMLTSNIVNTPIIPYATITTSIAGPIPQGVIKLFGDNPNKEFWV